MGQFSDMLEANKKDKARRDADEAQRRAENKAAYESSGAAKQIEAMKKAAPAVPALKVVPQEPSGSLTGAAKKKLMTGEGIWK